MNIPDLFSTKERVQLLQFVLYETDPLKVNKVAQELKISKGLVSKFFDILIKEKVLKRKENDFFVQDKLATSTLKLLLNLNGFDSTMFKKYKFVRSAGLYGSVVKGKNTIESDIDVWVFIDKVREEELIKLTNELQSNYRNIKPLYLTKEKLQRFKKEDTVFYYSMIFGSITIYGDNLEEV